MIQSCFTKTSILLLCSFGAAFSANAEIETTPIVGGSVVNQSSVIAKRTVGLYFFINENGQTGAAICSGSILDQSHILTAAHCVQNFKAGYVAFSASNIFPVLQAAGTAAGPSGQFPSGGLVQPMTSAVAAPGFPGMSEASGNGAEFLDLAVITFKGGLPPGYEPAHFLSKADAMSAFLTKPAVILSGYGMISAPAEEKQNHPNASGTGFPKGVGILHQVKVQLVGIGPKRIDLAVGGSTGHNACEGDSGGPAMIEYKNETYVVGVDSRGDCRTSSLYTFVNQDNLSALKMLNP